MKLPLVEKTELNTAAGFTCCCCRPVTRFNFNHIQYQIWTSSKRLKIWHWITAGKVKNVPKLQSSMGIKQNLVRKSLLLNRRTEVASQNDRKTWIHCLLKYQPSSFIKWMNVAIQLYNCCWPKYFSLNLSVCTQSFQGSCSEYKCKAALQCL